MDFSSIMGGAGAGVGSPKPSGKPAVEYTAQAFSPAVSGEVKLAVGSDSFSVSQTLKSAEIPYTEVNGIEFADYSVIVKTDNGTYSFSRMGEWGERFYDSLKDAYNQAVLRSLFVSGKPLVTARGEYSFREGRLGFAAVKPDVPVYVYEDAVVGLPPNLDARRIPLCFLTDMAKGDYNLTLKIGEAEYSFAKLGYDTAPIEQAVEKQCRVLRDKALRSIREIDPGIGGTQASNLSMVMPEGVAVTFGEIEAIAPSFIAALEAKIDKTRASVYYQALKELSDPRKIYVGFRKNKTGEPYLFWFIAPSPNGQSAIVEFSEADSATFVYKTSGSFQAFAGQLNRALEAINFKREVIRLSDAEIRSKENADYLMASKRTAALKFVRANFKGRVIHGAVETWKQKVRELC